MRVRIVTVVRIVTLVALVALTGAAHAQERRIQMKDLPPAVQKAVQEQTKGADVRGYAKEIDGGKTFYEVETKVNGRTRDLLFDDRGQLVEVEEELTLGTVPAAVRSAFEGMGKVSKVESVTKGQAVTYEAVIEKNGKRTEVVVDSGGKRIKG